jgi:serine/threonine protein kinase/TolB-like protein/Flp pilus assembly protein TadD
MGQQADKPGSRPDEGGRAVPDPTSGRWQKIKDLFGEALELDAEKRKAFLDQACDGDQSLRREVDSLLTASDPATHSVLEGTTPERDLMIGRRLGAYEILKLIGSGGMAAVYLAVRADDQYRKRVAIKLIHPGLEKEAVCRRFRSERQTLAALDHPNIVKLLDGGTTEEGLPYLVMDYVEGQSIDDYCDRYKLSIEERLRLFRTVCGAVQHAHQSQVVHRDLKPSNILVTAEGIPKLLDFGIAKLLSPEFSAESAVLTQTGMLHMTPSYASPEQVRGEPITYVSDIYSLGVLLYELLTGHRPYRFKSYTPAEVERVICETEAERPSTAVTRVESDRGPEGSSAHLITPESVSRTRGGQPEKLRRRLRGDLDNIVLKALHKAPLRRYSSVQEFSGDISRHLEHLPVTARRSTLAYRAGKLVRRRKTEVGASVLVLALAVGLAYSLWRPPSTQEGDSIAVARLLSRTSDASAEYVTEGVPASIVQNLSQIPKLRVIAVRLQPGEEIDPRTIGREFQVKKILTVRTLEQGDSVRLQIDLLDATSGAELWGDHYDRKLADLLGVQDQISREVSQRLRATLGEGGRPAKRYTQNAEAYQLFLQGRYNCEKRSAEGFRKGVEALQQALQIDPSYALAYAELSVCLNTPGYYGTVDPHQVSPKARAAAIKALELDSTLAEAHEALATSDVFNFDWVSAEQEFKRSLELNPNYYLAHFHYAMALASQGRFKEAVKEVQEGQDREPMSPVMNAGVAFIMSVAAEEDPGMLDKCVQQSRTNLEIAPLTLSYLALGMCYEQKHMYKEAVDSFQKGIDLGAPYALLRAFEGHAYGHSGDKAKAREILVELQDLAKHQYISLSHLAMVYDGLGENDLAIEALQKAYETHDTFLIHVRDTYFFDDLRSDPRFQDLERKVGVRQ